MNLMDVKKLFILVMLVILGSTVPSVHAETITAEKTLLVSCDGDKNEYKPFEELVVVDLRKNLSGSVYSSEDLSRQIYYEFAFVKNRKISPFNAIYTGGKLYLQQCDQKDISSRVLSDSEKGMFIIGVTEDIGAEFQQLVTTNDLIKFSEATMVETGLGIRVENKVECKDLCRNLKPATKSWKERSYSVAIEKVVFSETVDQKDFLDVTVFVQNNGENPIYGDSTAPLYVVTVGSSAFYDQSWPATDKPQKNAGVLQVGQKAELKFKMNTPLVPGDYEQKFRFQVGNVALKTDEVKVSFKVNNNGLTLGVIRPKDAIPFARVRASESLTSAELFRLDVGDIVVITQDNGAWLQILTKQGNSGWMYRPNIKNLN